MIDTSTQHFCELIHGARVPTTIHEEVKARGSVQMEHTTELDKHYRALETGTNLQDVVRK